MLSSSATVAILFCLAGGAGGMRVVKQRSARADLDENRSVNSGVIVNEEIWRDVDGAWVKASFGGHITEIDGIYYWVGNDPDVARNGADIYIYSSRTLGSDSWKLETKAIDVDPGITSSGMNCKLLRSQATGKYVIVAKSGLKFYQSSRVSGPYELVRTLTTGQVGNRGAQWKLGGLSAFEDGNDAYVIVSRRDMGSDAKPPPRNIGIYKLTPDFLNVEREVLWLPTVRREAMWVFKRGSLYYMTMSHAAGWNPSECYYRTASRLGGPWSEEREIGFEPKPMTKLARSHGTQCRWIMSVGNDQWMFGGDRYPYKPDTRTTVYDRSKGFYGFHPVHFNGSHPIVQRQLEWQVPA